MKHEIVDVDSIQSLSSYLISEGLEISATQGEKLAHLVDLLKSENETHNLISRADIGNIWTRHIAHSISPLINCSFPPNVNLLDIGTGGGLPGIPLAILRPDFHVTLAESVKKKTGALERIVASVGLPNIRIVNSRVEKMGGSPDFREKFDLTIARAVASLGKLIQWSIPLLRKTRASYKMVDLPYHVNVNPPAVVALKGGDLSEEIMEAKGCRGVSSVDVQDLTFPANSSMQEKKLVIVHCELS